jgi:predicted transcriptional regulator
MNKASMNFPLIKEYVSFLLINGLLIREGATYKITDNGMFFFENISPIKRNELKNRTDLLTSSSVLTEAMDRRRFH